MKLELSLINGDNILYHYIQKLLLNDSEVADEVIENFIINLSIWLPPSFYQELPIILPYVVRDPSCRRRNDQDQEEWGTANENGFLRDDNSLIKGVPKSFLIKSKKIKEYNGQKLGNGFVSSHIWRVIQGASESFISNRNHQFNSFVPNIVWLPRQISKLTNRDNSVAQKVIQAISFQLYEHIYMPQEINRLWASLPMPVEYEEMEIDVKRLTFFKYTDSWMKKRKNKLKKEIDSILSYGESYDPSIRKVKCSRYLPTLARVPIENRSELIEYLIRYRELFLE